MLAGPAGAGKTTTLNCITGFCRPQTGRIELRSRTPLPFLLERMDHYRIVREAGAVRTFRNPRLFFRMTVLENMLLAQSARRSSAGFLFMLIPMIGARKAKERCQYWLDRLGLAHLASRNAGELPPGLRRRLEIARALATEPRLICMDEPQSGLDARERDQLTEQLLEFKRAGPAILLATHDLRAAERLSDHVIALDHGVRIAAGKPRELSGHSAVLRSSLGVPPGGEKVPRVWASC